MRKAQHNFLFLTNLNSSPSEKSKGEEDMYRGEKKNLPSSPASIISRVFQVSWFPKLKPKKGTKKQQSPPLPAVHRREGRFYSMADDDDDDGAYWRLSFRTEDRKSIIGIPIPRSREKEEKQYNHERRLSRKKELGRGIEDDGKRQPLPLPLKPVMEKYIFPIGTPVSNSRIFTLMSSVDEDYASRGRVSNSEGRISDKFNDENEFRAEPVCMMSRKSNRRRIKPTSNSPKREFRVRVLEDRKKERAKSKKESIADGRTAYDSFAEAKTSYDPQKDFRDSMVEMICEKGIRRWEELEDLLACYLTLNRDHYHDLIIKVFRQVWFELLRAY